MAVMRESDDLQLFSLAMALFPIFIFYFKTIPNMNSINTNGFRGIANILLLCWFLTVAWFAILLSRRNFDLKKLQRFMRAASYTQFSMIGIIMLILSLNLIVTRASKRASDSGFVYNTFLPPMIYDSDGKLIDINWLSPQIVGTFIFYFVILCAFWSEFGQNREIKLLIGKVISFYRSFQ
jgi:hypothetical protein